MRLARQESWRWPRSCSRWCSASPRPAPSNSSASSGRRTRRSPPCSPRRTRCWRHRLIVTTSGLPSLPAGKVYQLWLIGPARIVSAGLLPAASSGRTAPVLASGLASGDKLGLTVEPAPGSAQPTTPPILAMPVPL